MTGLRLRDLTMPLVLALLAGGFALASPEFLSPRNLSMLLIELAVTAVLALGMLLVILPGQIDLAAGSGVGLTGGVAAVLIFRAGLPAPAALVAAAVLALFLWTAMGLLIVRTGIPAFIVTLGGLLVFRGAFWLTIHSSTVPLVRGGEANLFAALATSYLPPPFGLALVAAFAMVAAGLAVRRRSSRRRAGLAVEPGEVTFLKVFVAVQAVLLAVLVCNRYRGVPAVFLILCIVAVIIHVTMDHTPFGRALLAVGGNEEAARVSGISVERTITSAFALMGLLVALSGFLQTSYAGAATVSVGELMELDAIAACVIGGASLKGGRGSVLGTLLGAAVMATLLNGMTLLAITPEWKLIARGTALVAAVLFDVRSARGRDE
jgi:D-xylose transport system permease protein